MVLKSAESTAHVMIAGMLPYLQWKWGTNNVIKSQIAKWFKPAARLQAADMYWDPVEECVKNSSDKMISSALGDDNDLYWAVDKEPPTLAVSPKHKHIQLEEELLNNLVSTVKTAVSTKKKCQMGNTKTKTDETSTNTCSKHKNKTESTDSTMANSQATSISQLTLEVQKIKQSHQTMMSKFDKLSKQMAAILAVTHENQTQQCSAGSHAVESGQFT